MIGLLLLIALQLPALQHVNVVLTDGGPQPTLLWTASTSSGVTGYRVSYGPQSGLYTTTAEVGNVTSWVIPSLDPTMDEFFTVQTESGSTISPDSNEVELPSTQVNPNTANITTADLAASMTALNANLSWPQGTPITFTASATGPSGVILQYQWWIFSGGQWRIVSAYSNAPTVTWTPQPSDVGGCGILYWVREVGSTATYDASSGSVVFTVF